MEAFDVAALQERRAASGQRYHEFLRVPAMSAGLYELVAGSTDPQQPHNQDEIYYVVQGRGQIQVGDEIRPVQPGSIIYVAAGVPHRFQNIEADLSVLVVFAPAESSSG